MILRKIQKCEKDKKKNIKLLNNPHSNYKYLFISWKMYKTIIRLCSRIHNNNIEYRIPRNYNWTIRPIMGILYDILALLYYRL